MENLSLKEQSASVFEMYPNENKVYATEDGNFFLEANKHCGIEHGAKTQQELKEFTRTDFEAADNREKTDTGNVTAVTTEAAKVPEGTKEADLETADTKPDPSQAEEVKIEAPEAEQEKAEIVEAPEAPKVAAPKASPYNQKGKRK